MLKINNYKYYPIQLTKEGKVILKDIKLNTGDCIGLPISFNEKKLDNYLTIVKQAIQEKIISDYFAKEYSLVFNVMEKHNYTYNQWKYLIDYARRNNIKFLVNIVEEYTPEEMENYIEKFAKNYKNNIRKFAFDNEFLKIDNNPLISKNQYTFKYIGSCSSLTIEKVDESYLNEYISNQINKGLNRVDFILKDGRKFDVEEVDNIKGIIQFVKNNYQNKTLDISFSSNFQYYTVEQFKKILEIEDYIKEEYNKDYELEFLCCDTVINKQQIINSNNKINDVVNYLKESVLSSYEKVLYVHKLLTEREFYNNEENGTLSRDVYTILNSNNIVSVGYSMLMNAIFNELNDENIKVTSELINMNNGTYRCINCVYINDEKYDVAGYYKIDISKNNNSDNLKRFMIPSKDFENISDEYGYVEAGAGISCGNLMRNSHYFQKYNNKNYGDYLTRILEWDENINNINENTLNFFDSKTRRNVLNKIKKDKKTHPTFYILDAINECIESTNPIPLTVTKEALETIFNECYQIECANSKKYANRLIERTVFNSLFEYIRNNCQNDIAKTSLEIEKGNITLRNKINKR